MSTLVRKFNALPRSGKWLVWTLVLVVAYFGIIEPALEMTAASKARADALAADLERERALTTTDSDQGRTLASGRLSFGEPYLPDNPANKPEALHNVVDAILAKHGIGNRVKAERHVRLPNDEAALLLGPLGAGNNVERLILDITFEAAPDVVAAIIAEFEQAKEVAAISRVEIRRPDVGGAGRGAVPSSGAKVVKATVSPEAWVLAGSSAGSNVGALR